MTRNKVLALALFVVFSTLFYQAWQLRYHSYFFHDARFQPRAGHDSWNFYDSWLLIGALKSATPGILTDFSAYSADVEAKLREGDFLSEGKPAYLAMRTASLWLFTDLVHNKNHALYDPGKENFTAHRAEYFIYFGYFTAICIIAFMIGYRFFSLPVGVAAVVLLSLSTILQFHIYLKYYVISLIFFLLLAVWFVFRSLEKDGDVVSLLLGSLFVSLNLLSHPRNIPIVGFLWISFLYGMYRTSHAPLRIYPYLRNSLMFWSCWLLIILASVIYPMIANSPAKDPAAQSTLILNPLDDWKFFLNILNNVTQRMEDAPLFRWFAYPLELVNSTDGILMVVLLLSGSLFGLWRLLTLTKSLHPVPKKEGISVAVLLFFVLLGLGFPLVIQAVVEIRNYGNEMYTNRNYIPSFMGWVFLSAYLVGELCLKWDSLGKGFKTLLATAGLVLVCFQGIVMTYMHETLYSESYRREITQNGKIYHHPLDSQIKDIASLPDQILKDHDVISSSFLLRNNNKFLSPTFMFTNYRQLNHWILFHGGIYSEKMIHQPYTGRNRTYLYATKSVQEAKNGKNPLWLNDLCLKNILSCVNWRLASFSTLPMPEDP